MGHNTGKEKALMSELPRAGTSDQDYLVAAKSRMVPHLAAVIGRRLPPREDLDPEAIAKELIHGSEDNEYRKAIIGWLDKEIPAAAQREHSRGISLSERKALGGSETLPDYLMGHGDQKAYDALNDSNLLNAALGRQPVPSVTHLARGMNHAVDADGNAAPVQHAPGGGWFGASEEWTRGDAMNRSLDQHLQARLDPTRHSNVAGSAFPQHSLAGPGGTVGNLATSMGDTYLGQALGTFTGWSDGSRRAARRTDGNWATNLPGEIGKGLDHEWAKQNVGRASPQVPDGLSPDERRDYIDLTKDSVERSKPPTITEYGAAHGKTYSPLFSWAADSMHELVDPTVAVTVPMGGVGALAKTAMTGAAKGVGRGVLRNLITAPVKSMAGEVAGEVASPINWATLAPSFPISAGSGMFTAPSLGSLPDGMGENTYPAVYKAHQNTSDKVLGDIREMRGMLKK
jgi:hypothetical protein